MDELQHGESFFQLLGFLARVKAEDVLFGVDAQRLQDLLAGVAARLGHLRAVRRLHLNGADLEQHGDREVNARRNDAEQQGKGGQTADDPAPPDGRAGQLPLLFALPAAGAAEVGLRGAHPPAGAVFHASGGSVRRAGAAIPIPAAGTVLGAPGAVRAVLPGRAGHLPSLPGELDAVICPAGLLIAHTAVCKINGLLLVALRAAPALRGGTAGVLRLVIHPAAGSVGTAAAAGCISLRRAALVPVWTLTPAVLCHGASPPFRLILSQVVSRCNYGVLTSLSRASAMRSRLSSTESFRAFWPISASLPG